MKTLTLSMQCHFMMQKLKLYCKMYLPLFVERQGHDESGYRDIKDYYLRVKQILHHLIFSTRKLFFNNIKG